LSSYVILYFLVERVNPLYAILVVTNPIYIDLICSQIRSALAVALLILAFQTKRKKLSFLFSICALGIHTVAFYLLFVFHLLKQINRHASFREAMIITIILGISSSVFFAFGLDAVLSFLGDRRAKLANSGSSLLYSVFWFSCAIIIIIGFKSDERLTTETKLISLCVVFLMTQFLFNSVFGIYGSRFLAIGFPLLFVCISVLRINMKVLILSLLVFYQSVQIFYWW